MSLFGPRIYGPAHSQDQARGFAIARQVEGKSRYDFKGLSLLAVVLIVSNILTFRLFKTETAVATAVEPQGLFLLHKAGRFVKDLDTFEQKVRLVSEALDIPPEWLMAVMHSESKFNPGALNHRGSGATGLIQFMVPTVRELNDRMGTEYYMKDIQLMPAHEQLNLVYEYLQQARERYGDFDSLTDLYLAILYPKALSYDACYIMYAKPSKMYRMNSGLDENRDGRVTVSDIDMRMKRLYGAAYVAEKPGSIF